MPDIILRMRCRELSPEDFEKYMQGYNAYPEWPKIEVNGKLQDAPPDSLQAEGYRDHYYYEESRLERLHDSFEDDDDETRWI